MSGPVWRTSRFEIDLARPRVMGIVNVTPDSFSDGGSFADPAIFSDNRVTAQLCCWIKCG